MKPSEFTKNSEGFNILKYLFIYAIILYRAFALLELLFTVAVSPFIREGIYPLITRE